MFLSLSAVHDRKEGFLDMKAFGLSTWWYVRFVSEWYIYINTLNHTLIMDSEPYILVLGIVGQKTFPAMVHVHRVCD